jgi:transposase
VDFGAATGRRRSLVPAQPLMTAHLIRDNYGTHKHPALTRGLEAHSRIYPHFTPTWPSWLNLVERWFGLITGQAIRRGSFDSVRQLEEPINPSQTEHLRR